MSMDEGCLGTTTHTAYCRCWTEEEGWEKWEFTNEHAVWRLSRSL